MRSEKRLERLLITGAAGGLGTLCRARLSHLAETLRLSDIADLGEAAPHEELVQCDLGDKDAVEALVAGCDGIVHLGGRSVEDTWQSIRNANIDGVFNLYEAARKCGRPRIVFASSNHTIGFYRQTDYIDHRAPARPDGLYGVSKVFGEAIASMYHDKFGIETASIRIGSCFPEPLNHRMLSTWMSADDFIALIERIFLAPVLGCPVIYGVSANSGTWWDNSAVSYLGWRPKDNAEVYRAKIDAAIQPPAADAPEAVYQGGTAVTDDIHED